VERQAIGKTQKSPVTRGGVPQQSARSSLATRPLIKLQRSIGNQATQRLINSPYIQAKLQVSTPDDPSEQEADRVADTVMTMRENTASGGMAKSIDARPVGAGITRLVQRQSALPVEEEEEETVATKPISQGPRVAVREDDDDEKVAAKLDTPLQRQADESEEEEQEQIQPLARSPVESGRDFGVIQRLCTECAETGKEDETVHRMASPDQLSDEDDAEDEQVNPQASQTPAPAITTSTAANIRALNSGGSQLPGPTKDFFETRFGADFSHVRVHTDSRAAETAHSINAKAFTFGQNIAFGSGRYAPHTAEGQHLLAHELTHVVQQGAASVQTQTIQRQEEETFDEPVFEPTKEKIEEMEEEDEGAPVEQIGIVEPDEGTSLWPTPDPARKQPRLGLLPMNTRVLVDRKLPGGWYLVYVEGHQRNEPLPVAAGTHGYVPANRVNLDMPDPGAWFHRIWKFGQGALALAAEVYKGNFTATWGKDYRYLVNVLVTVNNAKNRKYIYKKNQDDSWDEAKTMLGGKIWVPGMELVNALHGQVSSGSITYEILTTIGNILIGVAAFIVGLLEGAVSSIADIFIGIVDLITLAKDIIVKLIRGTLIDDAKAFYHEIKKLSISDILEMIGAKWNHPSIWERWKFRGYVVGYAIVEILLLVFSAGALTVVKWAGKAAKLGKLVEYLSKLPKIQKVMSAAKALKGKGVDKLRTALKAAQAMSAAHGWAARVLRIPLHILKRLSEADIGKLKTLPQWARERFAGLADAMKLALLGCTSPCKVDVRKIEAALKLATKAGKKLATPDDVLAVLKKLNPDFKTAKISRKLRKKDSALMAAIREADITDADFDQLVHLNFITPGDLANPAQAYQTFVRYLTGVVPAKTGKDISKLNKIAAAIVKAEPRRGAAMKGSMFEQWVALHVPELASRTFTRITFDLKALLKRVFPPYSRPVDKWVPDKGEIWEIKHHLSKVPEDQAKDFSALILKTAPDGNVVKSVNYIFPTKEAAKLNEHLAKTYGFAVYYIDDATNALTKFL